MNPKEIIETIEVYIGLIDRDIKHFVEYITTKDPIKKATAKAYSYATQRVIKKITGGYIK